VKFSRKDYLSDAGVSKWIEEIGGTNAPILRSNITTALRFFDSEMPQLSSSRNRVAVQTFLRAPRTISAQLRNQYCDARAGAFRGPLARGRARIIHHHRRHRYLDATATGPAIDRQSACQEVVGKEFGVMAMAGGAQLIVPESYSHLLVEER
jgi:hypothetical protein